MTQYTFSETLLANGEVRLEWRKNGQPKYPLDFWIVPAREVEEAKARVRAGEFE